MANKVFKKSFAVDFKGISGECASIEPDVGEVNRALNYEYSVGNSLRGRVGIQTAGSNGFFAIFPYRYTRTQDQYDIVYDAGNTLSTTKTAADGSSIEKLIALNQQVWTLDTMNVTVTQTNAGTYTWYSYVSGSNINFRILKDGVSILDTSMTDGVASLVSIYSLLGTIDALADLSVAYTRGVCPPFALVNGAQNTAAAPQVNYIWGNAYRITVSNPHTFYPGDIISWISSSLTGEFAGGIVIARTATTIDYVGPTVTLTNGQVLGYMAQASTSFPISTVSSETSGALTIGFPYWRLLPEGDASGTTALFYPPYGAIFLTAYSAFLTRNQSFYAPATYTNSQGCLYVTTSSNSNSFYQYGNSLIKIDSQQPMKAGLPTPTLALAAPNAVGAIPAGTYKYKTFLRRVDNQGNIIDGPVSAISSITYTAPNLSGRITITSSLYSNATGFASRSCFKNVAAAPPAGTAFLVDDSFGNPAFIQPGDLLYATDSTAQTGAAPTALCIDGALANACGTIRKGVCTFYDGVSLSVKSSVSFATNIRDNSEISTGTTAVILRTTVGGNQYYVLGELPITEYASLVVYDNVADSVLITKEQYIEVPIGKEHNAPPSCSLVCEHQGGLVVARGPTTPNTVAYSTVDGIEYFPTASNSFEVPSTQSGSITAIASDTIDRLAVFKDKAYYDVAGDLDGGTFSVNVRNEGDYGVSSQASLTRVNNALIGLCKNGWVVIQDGLLDPYRFKNVSARLINQKYNFSWAVSVNDYFNRQYICCIPQITGEPVTYNLDYSRNKVIALERSYATKLDMAGGMAMVGDTLYHLSATSPYGVFRRLIRFNGDSPTGNDGDSFIDNTGAISYIFESQPETLGEPAQLKTPQKIRIWSIPNDYVIDGWVPFTFLLETGASPIASYIGSGGVNNTTATDTFSTANDVCKDIELKKQKTNFYIVRITVNTIRQSPFLTGYEIQYADNYKKEDLQK